MKIKKSKKIEILLMILLYIVFGAATLYGEGAKEVSYDSVEDIYITLKVRKLKNDFYPLIEYDNKKYIELEEFIKFMDFQTIDIIDNKRIEGKLGSESIQKDIEFQDNIVIQDSLYVELDDLKRVFPLKVLRFDEDAYSLFIDPKFKLPYEIAMEALERRRELEYSGDEVDEKYVFSNPKKLFDLGIVSAEYERYDFDTNRDILTLGYASQLLYGDFDISGDVVEETDLNYVNLDYYDVGFLGDRDVRIGDMYLRTYSQLPVERSLRGISITGNETYGRRDNDSIVLDGYARDAETVEIYQNGILVDYMDLDDSGIYNFEVETITNDDEYIIKTYYPNGRIEEEKRYALSSSKVFPKGNWDYIVQAGKGKYYDEDQAMFNIKYGLTNNLTIGGGYSRFNRSTGEDYRIIEGNLAYRTKAWRFPTLITLDYFYDTDYEEGSYLFDFTQKIGDYTFRGEYDQYGDRLASIRGEDKRASVSVGRSYTRFNWRARYTWERFNSVDYEEGELDLYYRIKNFRFYVLNTHEMSDVYDNLYTAELGVDFTGLRYFNLNWSTLIRSDDSRSDNKYRVRFSRRGKKGQKDHYIDAAVELEYDESEEWVASLEVTYYFDKFMRVELPMSMGIDDDAPSAGISVEKAIALKSPLKLQYIKDRDTFWVGGRVFKDTNGNGKYDVGELPMEGVGIRIDGIEVFTKDDGSFLAQNMKANEDHKIILIRETLDPTLDTAEDEIYIRGNIAEDMHFDIPLLPLSSVGGYINITNNKNNSFIFSKSIIEFLVDGEVRYSTSPEADGFFIIDTILPDEYDVEVTYLGSNRELVSEKPLKFVIPKNTDGDYYEVEYDLNLIDRLESVDEESQRVEEGSR